MTTAVRTLLLLAALGWLGCSRSSQPPGDSDGDGLSDVAEREVLSLSNPADPDTDDDGIQDGAEARGHTNPIDADSDGDGLSDGLEDANRNGQRDRGETDPRVADTDGDGVDDGVEDANQNGRQDAQESSAAVADLSPTHRNDVLGVPEPLLTDWVRALGARAGEFEVNALGTVRSLSRWELAPEVEWVPMDGLALELEAVFTPGGFKALKLGAQFTLAFDAAAGRGQGLQLITRWEPLTSGSLTALHLYQERVDERWSLGLMSGLEVGLDGEVAALFHPTVAFRPHPRVAVLLELNTRATLGTMEAALLPHLRLDVPALGSFQVGAGPTLDVAGGRAEVGLLAAARLTWER
jgi:hypothetical protein